MVRVSRTTLSRSRVADTRILRGGGASSGGGSASSSGGRAQSSGTPSSGGGCTLRGVGISCTTLRRPRVKSTRIKRCCRAPGGSGSCGTSCSGSTLR